MISCFPPIQTWQITLGGLVQGVGFRPFVYALAKKWELCGWVRNRAGVVEIFWQGEEEHLQQGLAAVFAHPPEGAKPRLLKQQIFLTQPVEGFQIIPGDEGGVGEITLPPDASLCPVCREELDSSHNPRYSWPFTACCRCGPRYSIIERFPYERENTTLHPFPLCNACQEEYQNPANRRFHAQATGCPKCGPHLYWHQQGEPPSTGEQALSHCLSALRRGEVVAVKGIGGYHLMADARQENAVANLRQHKPRPHKPLAILLDSLERAREWCSLTPAHEQALQHPGFPIVLCPSDTFLPAIAPGLSEVGIMLPYAPLHHILCREMATPLIATSANPTGEPVIWQPQEAEKRLGNVAQGFLHHNRTILRPADDGVVRILANAPRPLRLGRGTAPLEVTLPYPLSQPTLAVGGEQKITLALGIGQRAILSPHIGEIHSPRGLALFEQLVADFQKLLGVKVTRIIHDRHPHLATSRWAKKQGLPCQAVLHHHAHASALVGEAGGNQPWLIFTWDGVGLGEDGTLWGGEALLGTPGRWQRVASMRPFSLPGGDLVARQPWRSAASLCWECGHPWPQLPPQGELLHNAWQKGINAPRTSAVGRLFDAAAALIGLIQETTFEGQAPMLLEALASRYAGPPLPVSPLPFFQQDPLTSDWSPLLPILTDSHISAEQKSVAFHDSLATTLLLQCLTLRKKTGIGRVGLCGGVFQNALLTNKVISLLIENQFDFLFPSIIPVNDAGLSYGQLVEASHADFTNL